MKGRRKSTRIKSTFNVYFPAEIWTEILANLPVKSLLRFRCVSKTWREIIDNPNFISKHMIQYNNNIKSKNYVLFGTLEDYTDDSHKFRIRRSDTFRKCARTIDIEGLMIHASFDGLMLLGDFDVDFQMRLWNPSIRKLLLLPQDPLPLDSCAVLFALGFAPSSNEYKVVACNFVTHDTNDKPTFAVYGLNDNCWRIGDKGMDVVDWSQTYMSEECVCMKGATHRLVTHLGGGHNSHVVTFDFDAEELRYRMLPGGEGDVRRFHFVLGESLAVLGVFPMNTCIWVMGKDGDKESWTKWFSGDSSLDVYNFFHAKRYSIGQILYVEKSGVLFMVVHGNLVSYNIRNHEKPRIHRPAQSIGSLTYMNAHVESLLLHKGLEAQTLTSFP